MISQPKIALVHDYLTQLGGAEKVLKAIKSMYQEATLHTALFNPEHLNGKFDAWEIQTSFLQKIPWAKHHHRFFLPLLVSVPNIEL